MIIMIIMIIMIRIMLGMILALRVSARPPSCASLDGFAAATADSDS